MKQHLINLLFEQFKFNCFIYQFKAIGIKISKFEVNNNQIVLDIIGFPQNRNADHETFDRDGLDDYLRDIISEMVENEEVVLKDNGLHISENYELFVKGELAKYIDMLLKELDDPDKFEQASPPEPDQHNLPLNLKYQRKTSVLYVHFEKAFETSCRHDFEIYNPMVLPIEGEGIEFEWRDFIKNEDFIKELEDFDLGDTWTCNILFKKYYKDRIETHIVLMDEKSYKQQVKRDNFQGIPPFWRNK
jgi:hypothetical protein